MEEEKREEEVEELKDDFEEIKEMQKTQELKKIQEEKIVEEKKVEEKEKRCHPMFVTFLIIILMIAFTGMGFFGGVYYYKNSLNKKSDEVEKKDKKAEDSEWKDLGTDISKVKDIYEHISSYIYKINRVNGGNSFQQYELLSYSLKNINVKEMPLVGTDEGGQSIYFVSKDAIDEKLKGVFLDYKLDVNRDITGASMGNIGEYRIESYDKDKNGYNVKIIHTGAISGPQPTIVERKVVKVAEKDDFIKVEEKVIYISNYYDSYSHSTYYSIFKLPDNSYLIGSVIVPEGDPSSYTISVDSYLDKASTLTSYYKKNNDGEYRFVKSEITE